MHQGTEFPLPVQVAISDHEGGCPASSMRAIATLLIKKPSRLQDCRHRRRDLDPVLFGSATTLNIHYHMLLSRWRLSHRGRRSATIHWALTSPPISSRIDLPEFHVLHVAVGLEIKISVER